MIAYTATMHRTAIFSPCRTWRYRLERIWDRKRPYLMIVGLNPSVADETRNDHTVTKCIGYAQRWGFGGLWMLNIFAYCATDPRKMKRADAPIGPENDRWLVASAHQAGQMIVAWGDHGGHRGRDAAVVTMLQAEGVTLKCLGVTKKGYPKHPRVVRGDVEPRLYRLSETA